MYINNIRFLIIMACIIIPAITFFVWVCVTGKSEYQKTLDKIGERGEKSKNV